MGSAGVNLAMRHKSPILLLLLFIYLSMANTFQIPGPKAYRDSTIIKREAPSWGRQHLLRAGRSDPKITDENRGDNSLRKKRYSPKRATWGKQHLLRSGRSDPTFHIGYPDGIDSYFEADKTDMRLKRTYLGANQKYYLRKGLYPSSLFQWRYYGEEEKAPHQPVSNDGGIEPEIWIERVKPMSPTRSL